MRSSYAAVISRLFVAIITAIDNTSPDEQTNSIVSVYIRVLMLRGLHTLVQFKSESR